MLSKILAFFQPDLTKVLGQFNKAVVNLEKVEAHQRQLADKASAKIAATEAKRTAANQTADRANAVRANIKSLLGE